jgi:hypothetical protein
MAYFYISFADHRFLGAVIVEAESSEAAYLKVNDLGLNPGGEALICRDAGSFDPQVMNKLLRSKEEVAAAIGPVEMVGDLNSDDLNLLHSHSEIVCEHCNEVKGDGHHDCVRH